MIDIGVVAFLVLMGIYGYFTGLIRRVIGFLAIYAGFFAATNAGYTMAPVVRQAYPSWSQEDALMLAYFGLVVLIFVVVEVLAAFIHTQVQLSLALWDKPSGAIISLITAILTVTVATALLLQATTPSGFVTPDSGQIAVREQIRGSALAPALVKAIGAPVLVIFAPVIPGSPGQYFNYSANKTVVS